MLNRLILNRLALSLLITVSFPSALIGCQSNNSNGVAMPAEPTSSENVVRAPVSVPLPVPIQPTLPIQAPTKATTLQWASHYQWHLAQVKDPQGNLIHIDTANPITLAVAPSSLSLFQGCQHFSINFVWMSAPPFEYGSRLNERPSICKNTSENKISESNIKALFPKDNTLKLDIELLPLAKNLLVNTQLAPKNLVIKIENGNTLIFDGMPIEFNEPTGLLINNALLERYDWRLVSAVRNTFDDKGQIISRQSIGDFYHPDFPVSLQFRGYDDSQYAFFSSSCNGIGGPYILMKDYTLLVGSGPQTMMGCGVTGNRIENELSKLVSNSKSTLSLSLQPSYTSSTQSKAKTDFPRYNLLQTMASGKTLVWQNKEKPSH